MVAASLALWAWGAQALQITQFSPQGEVAQVRQVVVKFDTAAVNFGDPKAPAPITLSCSDASATQGSGRWTGEREWVFDFERDLPPGVRCTVTVKSGFKSASGALLKSASSYQFNSGGPFVQNIRPGTYQAIDEEQFFVLQLNGAATADSVQSNVWCVADGVGERIPVRLIEGAQRTQVLAGLRLDKAAEKNPQSFVAVTCNRRLTSGARMQVVYGRGVSTPSGIANAIEKRFTYTVREPFSAEFSCERENAQAACVPIRPMQLAFNAPVPRKLAQAIRLKSGQETLMPQVGDASDDPKADALVNSVQFVAPLAESTGFTLELPKDFKDASGRTLRNADNFPLKVATGSMPPLAKFAASPFGIVERFAEGPAADKPPALLPVTLRNVEAALRVQGLQAGTAPAGKVSTLQPRTDADIIAWFNKVRHYDSYSVDRKQARHDVTGALPKVIDEDKEYVQSRMVSLLAGKGGVKTLDLPQPASNDPRPFEVVGIPLSPGFHVVEIASQKLGNSLLDPRHGDGRTMFVRTSALVTNLGVHFKLGRENAMAWVTTLDKGLPVQGATVRVSDCHGNEVTNAITDAQGLARVEGLSSEPPRCNNRDSALGNEASSTYFISARHQGTDGVQDMAFTWSDWQR
ncbi:MAG: alpha-2-macroglobulin, partial [Burkholderiaceae bacterium]|nr:alpha-2-macroglobulin [Burkholderiaceae bacterium]